MSRKRKPCRKHAFAKGSVSLTLTVWVDGLASGRPAALALRLSKMSRIETGRQAVCAFGAHSQPLASQMARGN
ncbi:Hypothetical protein NTJ_09454 [Nesidiocoris tenuis]|uniref:Uncharacterized protein n=1 Tax=Nesidiocoris tenuis TaxID=355587 RepID=A0ABN7AWU1_9HEMI|nr:Hypothetical protein NTJ_09454 [Nesidiocoris tenuis]